MANRHVRAVQTHSRIEDHRARHVLEIIALDIGENDEPAHTGYRGISKRARIAVNTVQNDIETLINSGELIAIRDGQYIFYSLNTELIPVSRTSGTTANEKDASIGKRLATLEDLDTLYQKLYQMNNELYQKLYQNGVSTVSPPSTGADTEVKEDKEREERKEVAATAAPDYILAYENNIGSLTPIISKEVETAVITYGSQWVIDAIMEAVKAGVRKWNYVIAILRRWHVEGRGDKAACPSFDDIINAAASAALGGF